MYWKTAVESVQKTDLSMLISNSFLNVRSSLTTSTAANSSSLGTFIGLTLIQICFRCDETAVDLFGFFDGSQVRNRTISHLQRVSEVVDFCNCLRTKINRLKAAWNRDVPPSVGFRLGLCARPVISCLAKVLNELLL